MDTTHDVVPRSPARMMGKMTESTEISVAAHACMHLIIIPSYRCSSAEGEGEKRLPHARAQEKVNIDHEAKKKKRQSLPGVTRGSKNRR